MIVVYINAPSAKQTELMINAASTPYAETTNPPILAPKQRAALQVALLSALAVSSSFSSVILGIEARSAGMNTAWKTMSKEAIA